MRLAIAGKGGAGKTTLSAVLARLAARQGGDVVAIDADANPNLAAALGVSSLGRAPGPGNSPPPETSWTPVPASLVSRRQGGRALIEPVERVLDSYAVRAADGVRLLGMGAPANADEGCLCSAHAVVSALLEDLGQDRGRLVIVDMEASPEHLSRGTVRHADTLCLLAEPYYRSLETVRRLAALAAQLPVPRVVVVSNKVRSSGDQEAIAEFCARHGLELAGILPWSDQVVAADRQGVSVIDWPGASAVVDAARVLVDVLAKPSSRAEGD